MANHKGIVTLHQKVRNYVENLLQEYTLKNIDILPPEERISSEFNVSRGTVRRAMSDLVNEGLLSRVPGKGTFIVPGNKQKKEVVIFSPWDLAGQSFYENLLLKGLYDELQNTGYFLSMKHFDADELSRAVEDGNFRSRGMILVKTRRGENVNLLHKLAMSEIPFVVVGSNVGWEDINCVTVDNYNGIKSAFDYLFSLGHSDIAYIGVSPTSYDSHERFESFKAQRRANSTSNKYAYMLPSKKEWKDEVEDIFITWQKTGKSPTALITGGFSISLILLEVMKKYHQKIPEDLSVVGFDDFPAASHLNPPLTVVRQPIYEMGKETASLLLNAIENSNDSNSKQTKILPTELLIRDSCIRNRKGVKK
jgi:GntR family transcriptional regulator, arabinose operon transcriptional repressor